MELAALPPRLPSPSASSAMSAKSFDSPESASLVEHHRGNLYTAPRRELHGVVSQTLDAELGSTPHGRHLGVFSVIVIFVLRILGLGVFATPALVYKDVGGSPLLFLATWVVAGYLAYSGLYVFLEMGLLVPRSGGAKVFLEFIYPTPRLLATVVFSLYLLAFGFLVTNAIVFGKYTLKAVTDTTVSEASARHVGLLLLVVTTAIHGLSTRHGVWLQNAVGLLKLALLAVLILVGIYVVVSPAFTSQLLWTTESLVSVKYPVSVGLVASAIIKALFSFAGWTGAHIVALEIANPTRTFRIAGPVLFSLILVAYLFINAAYLYVVPLEVIISSGELLGSIFFEQVLGPRWGKQFLTLAVAICAAGNVFVVVYGILRMSQEVFREGWLPGSRFMASNWPVGAPLPALLLSLSLLTAIMLGMPPSKGALYEWVVELEGYLAQLVILLVLVGVFVVRRRHPDIRAPIRASIVGSVFILALSAFLLILPLLGKPAELYPNYGWVLWGLVGVFTGYWAVWAKLLPWWGGYERVSSYEALDDGLVMRTWGRQGKE